MKRFWAALASMFIALSLFGAKLESLPRVYPAGHAAEIAITVNDQEILDNIGQIELRYKCDDNRDENGQRLPFDGRKLGFRFEGGKVLCRIVLRDAQSHTVNFVLPPSATRPAGQRLGAITFFSLSPEDFRLRPFKGDFHTHCVESGHGKLEPAVAVAYGRKVGLDFMALSEHRITAPAAAARARFSGFDSGYEVIIGEESHADKVRAGGSMIHMLSIGIDQSVTQYLITHKEEFERQIAERKKELPAGLKLDDVDREELVASEIMAGLARRFGGIAIFAHPFWQPYGSYNATVEYSREIVRRGNFNAWELVVGDGGGDEAIFKGIAWYNDLLKEGHSIRVVGTSDCHDASSPTFGSRFTLVLADSNRTPDVIAAIVAGRSFGVRKFAPKVAAGIVGPYRYIDYAYFLESEYFPGHDELCARQGELLLKVVAGDQAGLTEIGKLREAIAAYQERFFYKE